MVVVWLLFIANVEQVNLITKLNAEIEKVHVIIKVLAALHPMLLVNYADSFEDSLQWALASSH